MLLDKIKLEENERIIIQTRRHWFVIVSQVFSFVLAAITPLLLLLFASFLFRDFGSIDLGNHRALISFGYSAWLFLLWLGVFSVFNNYYLDILTLTDRRIIVINQKGFFWRNTASFRLERLQDMNVEVNGVIATLLDFGDINVETAGHSDEEFKVTNIPHPRELKALVLEASDNRMKKAGGMTEDGL
ncbi:PH domain-containing protein [Candidatus Kaiserbacteria bacterium]|nr:PH domain-containing protein [Candidatus Kaiserbacteria bacterium]MCP5303584.1 PH domain-containing protein [Pseudomonadales bacterium]